MPSQQESRVPTNEQRREAAKRKLDRQLARRAERAKARRRYAVAGSAAAVVLVVGIVVLSVMLSNRGQKVDATAKPSTPVDTSTAAQPRSDSKLAASPVRPKPLPASVDCRYTASQQPPAKPVKLPRAGSISATGTARVTMQTSVGAIGLTLDRALAPCTVNSFISLAKQGFYANSPCHRLVTNPGLQVLQCGDPTGSGAGGPGYTIPDEVFPQLSYGRGLVAMANTGQPDSGGSQFFLIYGQTQLPPQYTVFASISPTGLEVLDQIAKAGDDGSLEPSPGGGKPNQPVTITSVDVKAT
jgi:peptidyl-prolyl cis-trans isomerase B (cyclophilin B)